MSQNREVKKCRMKGVNMKKNRIQQSLNNRLGTKWYRKILGQKRMTYVIGARCRDGVVIIGDRKVTGGVSIDPYEEKIRKTPPFNDAVFAAAGLGGLFEEFLEELPKRVLFRYRAIELENKDRADEVKLGYGMNDFKHDVVDLLKQMKTIYSEVHNDGFPQLQVFFAVKHAEKGKSVLYYIDDENCLPAEVKEIIPIGESNLGEIFRKSWKKDMSMLETAKLGAFIIKYIEAEKLSDGVGVGSYQPQIWFVEDNQDPREVQGAELNDLLKDVNSKVDEIRKSIGSLSRFLRN